MSLICPREPPDLRNVIEAAEALYVSEYDFFRLAFRRWSGHEPEDAALERAFVDYMFQQTVPHWVRHFARETNTLNEEGRLVPAQFGALEFQRQLPPPRHGRLCVGAVAVATVLYSFALMGVTYDHETSAPMPCYGGPGFQAFSEMAYAMAGKRPPDCDAVKKR